MTDAEIAALYRAPKRRKPPVRKRRRRPVPRAATIHHQEALARQAAAVLTRRPKRRHARRRVARAYHVPGTTTAPSPPGGIAVGTLPFERRYPLDYRVFTTAEYRFYRAQGAPPAESDTPFATSPTLAFTDSGTRFGDGTWYVAVSYFDGVLDSGFLPVGPGDEPYLTLELVDEQIAPICSSDHPSTCN